MLEEAFNLDQLQQLAERRDDDLCDIGTVNTRDEVARMQMANLSSQEYAQLYASYIASAPQVSASTRGKIGEPVPLDELDADELLLDTMSDRQKLAELGKLVGTARYAVGGQDNTQLLETKRSMERIVRRLPEKYRGSELITSAVNPKPQGARLAELYLSRAYKLLDEEYAEIPGIERAIRELQE
jgi:hypothetical protein